MTVSTAAISRCRFALDKVFEMGFRVSWIARRGSSTAELLKAANRYPTGERHDFPDIGCYLVELPGDDNAPWVMLIASGTDNFADLADESARLLSEDGSETIYFWCSDTVMSTELVCFRNGTESWSVKYDCETGTDRPELKGDLPAVAHEILAKLIAQQDASADADYIYDMTAELGLALTGFRHDQDLELNDPEPFQILSDQVTPRRPWWRFWQ